MVYQKLLKSYTVHELQQVVTKIKFNFVFVYNFTYYIITDQPTTTCTIGKWSVSHDTFQPCDSHYYGPAYNGNTDIYFILLCIAIEYILHNIMLKDLTLYYYMS